MNIGGLGPVRGWFSECVDPKGDELGSGLVGIPGKEFVDPLEGKGARALNAVLGPKLGPGPGGNPIGGRGL